MGWLVVGVAGGSALLGAYQQSESAKRQQEAKRQEMLANATQIQMSPWTGIKSGVIGNSAPDPTSAGINGALQGGVTGAMMASQFGKTSTPPPPNAPPAAAPVGEQLMTQPMTNSAGGGTWDHMQKPNMYGNPYTMKS